MIVFLQSVLKNGHPESGVPNKFFERLKLRRVANIPEILSISLES
jgi:hypothetical protein